MGACDASPLLSVAAIASFVMSWGMVERRGAISLEAHLEQCRTLQLLLNSLTLTLPRHMSTCICLHPCERKFLCRSLEIWPYVG